MKNDSKSSQGYMAAFLAALCYSTIGVFSVKGIESGVSAFATMFYRCLFAMIIITIWLIIRGQFKEWMLYLKKFYLKIAICACLSIFLAATFETNAYRFVDVPVVIFLFLGSSTIINFVLSAIIHKRILRIYEILSCLSALIGLGLMFGINSLDQVNVNLSGIILAIMAGVSYGAFLTVSHIFKLGSGLMVVNSFLLFGTLYQLPIFMVTGFQMPSIKGIPFLLGLAIISTIGGLWFVTKSLSLLKSSTVQLMLLTEPIFATILSYFILNQHLSYAELIGGALIIVAILINYYGKSYSAKV